MPSFFTLYLFSLLFEYLVNTYQWKSIILTFLEFSIKLIKCIKNFGVIWSYQNRQVLFGRISHYNWRLKIHVPGRGLVVEEAS